MRVSAVKSLIGTCLRQLNQCHSSGQLCTDLEVSGLLLDFVAPLIPSCVGSHTREISSRIDQCTNPDTQGPRTKVLFPEMSRLNDTN